MHRSLALAAVAMALLAPSAHAQSWGLRGGATFDPDQIHAGAHVFAGELFTRGYFVPNVEIGFGDHLTLITINPELVYRFQRRSAARWGFYIGGGLGINVTHWNDDDFPFDEDEVHHGDDWWHDHHEDDTDTDLGLNVLGGMVRTMSSGNELFLELKLGLVDSPDAKLTLGVTFD